MKDAIKKLLGDLLTSKKAVALIAAALAWVVGKLGLDIPSADLLAALGPMLGLVAVYILGQGLADKGKEAAKVSAAAMKELAEKKD